MSSVSARRLLVIVSLVAGMLVAHASAKPDQVSIAAMVAEVSPAVVRVMTVRPGTPERDKPGAHVANASAASETNT